MFAKLYNTTPTQILVTKVDGREDPEGKRGLKFTIEHPINDIDCMINIEMTQKGMSYETMEKMFDECTEDWAINVIDKCFGEQAGIKIEKQ